MNGALLRAAAECWGTGLQFDPLPGEYDLNYMVSGAHDGVLKIMNAGRDRADTDLQVAMLDHLRGDETLLVPGVIKTLSGAATAELPNVGGPPRLPRLISRLPGQTLAATTPVTAALFSVSVPLYPQCPPMRRGFSAEHSIEDMSNLTCLLMLGYSSRPTRTAANKITKFTPKSGGRFRPVPNIPFARASSYSPSLAWTSSRSISPTGILLAGSWKSYLNRSKSRL